MLDAILQLKTHERTLQTSGYEARSLAASEDHNASQEVEAQSFGSSRTCCSYQLDTDLKLLNDTYGSIANLRIL